MDSHVTTQRAAERSHSVEENLSVEGNLSGSHLPGRRCGRNEALLINTVTYRASSQLNKSYKPLQMSRKHSFEVFLN